MEAVLSVPFSEEALSVAVHASVSVLTAGVESSQEPLHSHCHAARDLWTLVTGVQPHDHRKVGRRSKTPPLAGFCTIL